MQCPRISRVSKLPPARSCSGRVDIRMDLSRGSSALAISVAISSHSCFWTISKPIRRMHPSSDSILTAGIATLTLILSGQAFYKETTEREGVIETGGVEWMRASGGVWHTGGMSGTERIKGFQLWVAMPPALELAEPDSQYLGASEFQFAGPARVIAGEYDGVKSVVRSPEGMTYLDVRLKAGDRWVYQPPQSHSVAWIASHQGTVSTPSAVSAGEAVVFEEGSKAIEFEALTDTGFVLGSAVKHPYDLVTGHYSVHTTAEALRQGEKNIAAIGHRLHNQGVLSRRANRATSNQIDRSD